MIQNIDTSSVNAIVSHNGTTFDFIFLKRLMKDLKESGEDISKLDFSKFVFIDTLLLSRRLLPNRSYYSQPSLAKTFQIPNEDAHRALGDVIVLEQIYSKCVEELCRSKNSGFNNLLLIKEYINLDI